MSGDFQKCKNCGTENISEANFCIKCGQKLGDKLNLKLLFYNTIGNYFSFDARFFRSIIPLMFRPGYIASEFVKGKRLQYLHPGQMYLFVTVVFFFVFNYYVREGRKVIEENAKTAFEEVDREVKKMDTLSQIDPAALDTIKVENFDDAQKLAKDIQSNRYKIKDTIPKKNSDYNSAVKFDFDRKVVDSLIASEAPDEEIFKKMGMAEDAGYFTRRFYSQGLKLYKTMGFAQVYQYFIDSIPLAMFILMPLFAFFLKIFYYKRGNYSHHLVFSFYFFCFLFTVFSIVLGVNLLFENIPAWISWLTVVSTFFYLWRAVVKFYKQHWFLSLVKSGIISWIYLFLVIPLAFVIMLLIAFLFY
jgi:hypothetical protein